MTIKVNFTTQFIPADEALQRPGLSVSRWLPKGGRLLSITAASTGKDNTHSTQEVELGDFVEFAEDGGVVAKMAGYPRLAVSQQGKKQLHRISLEPMISVDDQGLLARLTLYPANSEEDYPSKDDILAIMQDMGICYGIRQGAIDETLEEVAKNLQPVVDRTVARGRLPVHGRDGYLRLELDTAPQAGLERGDGGVDYRERNLFVAVQEGQLLATRVAANPGLAGVNIFGEEVPQLPAKELEVTPGTDISFDPVSGEIRAMIAGTLSVTDGRSVMVSDKNTIDGDIDFTTGNLNSPAAVEIKGNVRPGFSVVSKGNLLIAGEIEAAKVDCHARLVAGGVCGESEVIAGGEAEFSHINNGLVIAGAGLVVKRQIYYATVAAGRDVRCEGEGRVLGAVVCAGDSLYLGSVDTPSSGLSFLAAAVDFKRLRKHQELSEQLLDLERQLRELQHRLGPEGTNKALSRMEKKIAEVERKLAALNLVPGGAENDRLSGMRHAGRQKIVIGGNIQAGVELRIGNITKKLDKVYTSGSFLANQERDCLEYHSADGRSRSFL